LWHKLLFHFHSVEFKQNDKGEDFLINRHAQVGTNAPFLTRIVESGESDLKVEESQANLAPLMTSGGKPDPDHAGAVSFV